MWCAGCLPKTASASNTPTKAREWIAAAGYDPLYGARPVKRTIQRYVVNDLSKRILAGDVNREQPIRIDADDKGLTFAN